MRKLFLLEDDLSLISGLTLAFKKQGFAIVIVAIFTFAGTFLGSTIIAQIILKMTGVI